ncbi:MAG: phosphoribosylformylglycinamidine cyclo-ligase [Verrucomicrobiota bacterium]
MPSETKITYKDAGVDIHAAADVVDEIGALRARTEKNRKLHSAFGLFAAAYDLSALSEPIIVTGCDGVGTKIELLLKHGMLAEAGKDLVAMNVNDVLTTGMDPILFLDYVAIPKIDQNQIKQVIEGIVAYCESCDCILAGGETAEMPGLVPEGGIEMSGFCIGAGEKRDLIDPSKVAAGDVLVGYPSDGFHANGWSLVRRILSERANDFSESEIISLLAPTRLYHDVITGQKSAGVAAKAHAHITGGGIPENLKRVTGALGAKLQLPTWENPPAQKVLESVEFDEATWTFNMGYGWVTAVAPEQADAALTVVDGARVLGEVSDETDEIRIEAS